MVAFWFVYHYWESLRDATFYGREAHIDYSVAVLLVAGAALFSIQNIIATPLATPQRARIINIAVLAAWGTYWGYGSIAVGEGQDYAIFGLKLLLITAAPILWVHRKG